MNKGKDSPLKLSTKWRVNQKPKLTDINNNPKREEQQGMKDKQRSNDGLMIGR